MAISATLSALNIYPVKSCRGIPLQTARVAETGLADDRHWMMVRPNGRFVTQRELPRLALIGTSVNPDGLQLTAPGMPLLSAPREAVGSPLDIVVWKFSGGGIDYGDDAAAWCTEYLGTPLRLVRFDVRRQRICNPAASTAVPINARRGSSRCVTKRPLGRTIIQCRSSARPVAATRALCSGMPRQDLTG